MKTYLEKIREQQAWQARIQNDGFTHFVTFIYNLNDMDIDNAKKKIGQFRARIDRQLYGKKYTELKRTSLIAFPEHLESNLHYHAALTTTDINGFNKHADTIWKTLVAAGEVHIECKNFTTDDTARISSYITKDYLKQGLAEHFIML